MSLVTVESPKYEYCSHVMRLCNNAQVCSKREFDDYHNKTEPYILRSGNSCQEWSIQRGGSDGVRDIPIVCKSCGKIRLHGGCDPYCTSCHFKYRTPDIPSEEEFVR